MRRPCTREAPALDDYVSPNTNPGRRYCFPSSFEQRLSSDRSMVGGGNTGRYPPPL